MPFPTGCTAAALDGSLEQSHLLFQILDAGSVGRPRVAFLINQVYVLYFNSKPANISYLTDQYSTGESFKFGFIQLVIVVGLVTLWAQYVMPLMGFNSRLW